MNTVKPHNAITHGAYARESVLPWEDAERFESLHSSLRAELNPNGPIEEAIVAEIADLYWRKRRLAMGAQIAVHRVGIPEGLAAAANGGPKSIADFMAQNSAKPGGLRMFGAQAIDYVKAKARGETPPPVEQVQGVAEPDVVSRAYDPATMIARLRAESLIDTRIAKLTARLAMSKEYRKLYGAPVPVAPDAPPLEIDHPRRTWGQA